LSPATFEAPRYARMGLKGARVVYGMECPRCGGPMRLISVIEDPAVARKILEHLGLPARPPPRGRRWGGQLELALDEAPEPALDLLDPRLDDDADPA